MELAIQEGCGSPITCPDMVCLNHGTLQEAEVSILLILLSFSFSLFFNIYPPNFFICIINRIIHLLLPLITFNELLARGLADKRR